MNNYNELFNQAADHPETYWAQAAQDIDWDKPWDNVLDDSKAPLYRWFVGGEMNTCYNAVDRHVKAGRGEQAALIYDSAITTTKRIVTYNELLDRVSKTAGALRGLGVEKGDRVIIYMPMIPQAVFAMLACARIGAIHSVVFGGFSAKELAKRIDDCEPKVILTTSCGIEPGHIVEYQPIVHEAERIAKHKIDYAVFWQRSHHRIVFRDNDINWKLWMEAADPVDCVPVKATDPLYILYTSGTTGAPKGVLRDHGGHAVALNWTMKNLYNCNAGDVFWAASDVGWVVGHSYICYAPLLAGCTSIIFEGKPVGTPDAGVFWRIVQEHNVKCLFTAPTAIRAIRREDSDGVHIKRYDISCLKSLFLAGEHCDPNTMAWAKEKLGVPVVDHWWQTETAWAITANCLGLDYNTAAENVTGRAVPGYQLECLDDQGNPVEQGQSGNIVAKLPLPPGTLQTLWKNDQRCIKSYFSDFAGYYLTGDAGHQDEHGNWHVMGRIDDIINVAGHRLSTGSMEEALCAHSDIAEAAVIGVKNRLKGQVPIGFIVQKANIHRNEDELCAEIVKHMRDALGAVASFKLVTVVHKLPKTRSGKILRATMRAMADDVPYNMPPTIEDPLTLDEIKAGLRRLGYPRDQSLDIAVKEHQTKEI
ncbi:MAG: propionyl-CoA synthetase [Gammaproteobacteria bacterium]|nr:MAG: propionyl-CoA synthetase [Gammaproteobacteria bacterium]